MSYFKVGRVEFEDGFQWHYTVHIRDENTAMIDKLNQVAALIQDHGRVVAHQ